MVLLPAQDELVEIFKEHKQHVVCPKCLQRGRFQRDGFKNGKIRFTCSTTVATMPTHRSKPAKCNKHYTEAIMEQLLLRVIARKTRKAHMKLDGLGCRDEEACRNSGEQTLGGTATRTKAACSEETFLKGPRRILQEKSGGGAGGGNGGDEDVFEFVMTEGRFQVWMRSYARVTGALLSQEREHVYNQPKSVGMYWGVFWYKHRCSHSKRSKNRRALMPRSTLDAQQSASAGTTIATVILDSENDDDGDDDGSDTDKEAIVGTGACRYR
ncbi:hypothetical protein BGZ47_010457 [Haplosporangium gracile]|nr:hypothetical protein BGZ47_010457 [Haplosporangium gracile]